MRNLLIKPVEASSGPGDLGAHISGDDLLLPRAIAEAFLRQGVRSATDLVAQIDAFPGATARVLGWQPSEVREGLARLRAVLAEALPPATLQPEHRRRPGMGARDPEELSPVTFPDRPGIH